MNRKLFLFLFAIILSAGCKNNSVQISGTLSKPVKGAYVFLDELRANNLTTVDSVVISDKGTFDFKMDIKNPAFYLVKINDENFLTMLIEPGEKVVLEAKYDSLNFPLKVIGSKGTELMSEYNVYLRKTINKLTGLNNIYMQNAENPQLPKIIESLDSLATIYLTDINAYTKKYIDQNITSLVCLVALYQQVAPNVYVLNPSEDMKYFIKVDSSLNSMYPDYEPVAMLHSQVKEFIAGMPANTKIAPVTGGGAEEIFVTCSGMVEELVAPTLVVNPESLSGFNYLYGSGPSPEQSFTLSGTGLNMNDVIITPTTNYEISLTSGTGFQSDVTLYEFNGANTQVFVRLISGLEVADYNSAPITISGGGATDVLVTCNGTVTDGSAYPCLFEDFSGFTAGTHASPSTTDWAAELDTYTMYSGWTGLKVYSAGGEIKIGTSSANGYIITPAIDLSEGASLNFDYAQWGTDVSVIQIFHASDGINFVQVGVDITPTTDFQSYSLQINDGTTDSKIKIATDVKRAYLDNIEVFCSAYSPEAVLVTDPSSLSGFSYVFGFGPSEEGSYILSGEFLDGTNVTITPTTNYEVSLTSGTGFQSTQIMLNTFNGTETTVYVRLKADRAVGNYNTETINITGGGAVAGASVVCNGFVDPFVNVEFTNNDENLMIFPNPVNDILNVRLSETNSTDITWNIVSITGQVVMSGTMTSNNSVIDISNFKSGMYILNLRDDQNNYFRKFNKK